MEEKQNPAEEEVFRPPKKKETEGSETGAPMFKPKRGSVFPKKQKSVKSMMFDTIVSVVFNDTSDPSSSQAHYQKDATCFGRNKQC
ncbi:conserved hypothetical protein [Ricinus communis]|uniref:Uncharacterized protein n=1 Tax=Ricinus communis TaxID=3988 RepID=B9S2R7_RICCO|nr:conserved hypothetical protein [Ricinus communis]